MKKKLFGASAGLAFISGIVAKYFYPGQIYTPSDIFFMLANAFILFWWYVLDARAKNYKRHPFLDVSVVALSIIGLPYYFFRTRPIKGALVATLVLFLILLFWGILGMLGQMAVYASQQS